jgi:hypothetical protein
MQGRSRCSEAARPLRPATGDRRPAIRRLAGCRFCRPVLFGLLFALPAHGKAQDANFVASPTVIEQKLQDEPLQIVGMADNRWQGDRTQRVALKFQDGSVLGVKWARTAPGGRALNNQPQYEIAAYRLQKLFLDPPEYVVPPTVMRTVPLDVYRQIDSLAQPTFEGTASVLVVIQYWLNNVKAEEAEALWDPERFASDTAYARDFANLNVLTYLMRHADSNPGNVLISDDSAHPRLFAVDNGVAFSSPDSPRGTFWKELMVDRVPEATVRRLRALTHDELSQALSVVAQYRTGPDRRLTRMQATDRRKPFLNVEYADGIAQFGLTAQEIDNVWQRLETLLGEVDRGELKTF